MIENNPYFNYIKPIVSGQATWDLYITDIHDSVCHYTGILGDFEQRVLARYLRKCIKVENLLLFGDNVPEVKSVALSLFDKDDYHEHISIDNQQLSIEVQEGSNRSKHQFYLEETLIDFLETLSIDYNFNSKPKPFDDYVEGIDYPTYRLLVETVDNQIIEYSGTYVYDDLPGGFLMII